MLEDSQEFQVVGEAGTGAEALNLIALLTPDLVITDVDMPNGDGLDLAAHVRREFPRIRVILISGHTERQYEILAKEAGALAFIPKAALSLDALLDALQEGR